MGKFWLIETGDPFLTATPILLYCVVPLLYKCNVDFIDAVMVCLALAGGEASYAFERLPEPVPLGNKIRNSIESIDNQSSNIL